MEVINVLHMNGGIGDASYANNSLVQVRIYTHTHSFNVKFDETVNIYTVCVVYYYV